MFLNFFLPWGFSLPPGSREETPPLRPAPSTPPRFAAAEAAEDGAGAGHHGGADEGHRRLTEEAPGLEREAARRSGPTGTGWSLGPDGVGGTGWMTMVNMKRIEDRGFFVLFFRHLAGRAVLGTQFDPQPDAGSGKWDVGALGDPKPLKPGLGKESLDCLAEVCPRAFPFEARSEFTKKESS